MPANLPRPWFWPLACLLALWLGGCASAPPAPTIAQRLDALLPADVLLLGEQHDASEHHALERDAVQLLAGRGQLAALALEMAPAGSSTRGLGRDASQAQVQAALQWQGSGWPWADYRPAVMAAVRAGVPVVGANLPQAGLRATMDNRALDASLRGPALKAQQQAIRIGHCGLLPEAQIQPMVRIQIARDQRMAQVLAALAQSAAGTGQTVLLLAGAAHVDRSRGIPQHLPANLKVKVVVASVKYSSLATDSIATEDRLPAQADAVWSTAALPPKDYCAALRAQWAASAAPGLTAPDAAAARPTAPPQR